MLRFIGQMISTYKKYNMLQTNEKLHLGCGNIIFPGWLNIDLDSATADINLDLTEPLPFVGGSVTHIFSEHFIEHITREEAVSFLIECRRILAENGIIRIITPNLRFLVEAYITKNIDEWGNLWQPRTPCLMINEGFRSWGHQFAYDADELVSVFAEAGFTDVAFQNYQKSQHAELCGLDTRPFHNELIIEAKRTKNLIQSVNFEALTNNETKWLTKLTAEPVRLKFAENTITSLTRQIQGLAAALVNREQHLSGLEKTIVDQARHIQNVEIALISREQDLSGLNQTISDQTRHIKSVEDALETHNQHLLGLQQTISDQVRHINSLESVLKKFQKSLCWKFFSTLSQAYAFVKN